MKQPCGTWSATWSQGGGHGRSSSPRRSTWRFGLLPFVLVASFCLPVLAEEEALAEGAVAADAAGDTCPSLWSGDETARSFGLGGLDLGSGSTRPVRPPQPPPDRFSLCPGPLPTDFPDRTGLRWGPPPAAPPWSDPRDPLRGVRNASAPFGTKFRRGTLIVVGAEVASGFILALLPRDNTNWEEGTFSHGLSNIGRAWTTLPVWDRDVAFHNWFGHPYAGAFYYNMLRSQGATVGQSFAFSAFQSLMWEYVLESVAEQPSIQDLIATPLIGSVVGELFHRWSVAIVKKGNLNSGQKVLVFFLNPSYVINNGYRPPE